MMKKNWGRRALSLLLCMVMIFTMMPVVSADTKTPEDNDSQIVAGREYVDADGNETNVKEGNTINPNTVNASADGKVTISKTIAPTDKENYFDITLTVTDEETVSKDTVDVVLVVDVSNTMTSKLSGNQSTTRMKAAAAAAKTFAQ